jgi:hypothetical protein
MNYGDVVFTPVAKKGYTTVIHKRMNDLSPILAKSVDTSGRAGYLDSPDKLKREYYVFP